MHLEMIDFAPFEGGTDVDRAYELLDHVAFFSEQGELDGSPIFLKEQDVRVRQLHFPRDLRARGAVLVLAQVGDLDDVVAIAGF